MHLSRIQDQEPLSSKKNCEIWILVRNIFKGESQSFLEALAQKACFNKQEGKASNLQKHIISSCKNSGVL